MKAPAFQFYPDDFVGGVADMTQAEVGAYILLLCAQWGRGAIPTDVERAALIAKGPVTEHVMSKFPRGKNKRLEVVRSALEVYRAAQASNGAKGAAKRWRGDAIATPLPDNSGAIVSPMARNGSPSPSPSPSPISDSSFAPAKPPRARNELSDALARACGSDPREMTSRQARACAIAANEIKKATPSVDEPELSRRAFEYRRKYRDAALTPSALCGHWSEFANDVLNFGQPSAEQIATKQAQLAKAFQSNAS